MRRVIWLLLWVAMLTPASALARTILVVGDSLSSAYGIDPSAGWVALLQQRLDAQQTGYRVVNASIAGDITANGLARLPRLLATHKPEIVILELGANDGLRGLSLEQMKHNIAAMIQKAQAANARVLLVGIELPPNYGRRYLKRFERIYKDTAAARQVPLVPSLMAGFATDRAFLQGDGMHPNAKAQPRMLENVWAQLKPLL